MEKSRLSARSNMPPWPGIRFEKSFTPIMRFTSDSARSPICPIVDARSAVTTQSQNGIGSQSCDR